MIVVVANSIPDAVRGLMKLWFVEVKPYVFVSGVKDRIVKKIVDQLLSGCPIESGMIIFYSTNKPPYYGVATVGSVNGNLVDFDGLVLLAQKTRK